MLKFVLSKLLILKIKNKKIKIHYRMGYKP